MIARGEHSTYEGYFPARRIYLSSSPWQCSEEDRPRLLSWFLDADLSVAENFELLTALNGRRGPGSQMSPLRAEAVVRLETSPSTFIAFYSEIRRQLRRARELWQRASSENKQEQRELLATHALRSMRGLLAEVTALDFERDPETSRVRWPVKSSRPAPLRRSTSLPGELAIAVYDEMHSAKRAGLCKVCDQPWLSRFDKPRQLCGRAECLRRWRNDHRKPEDPEKVYQRVLRSRGVPDHEIRRRSRARRAKRGNGR
jgi:hypothetical protein